MDNPDPSKMICTAIEVMLDAIIVKKSLNKEVELKKVESELDRIKKSIISINEMVSRDVLDTIDTRMVRSSARIDDLYSDINKIKRDLEYIKELVKPLASCRRGLIKSCILKWLGILP